MSIPTTFESENGEPIAAAGKALLVVNTASECGFTPQYAGLQSLWRRYRDRGLAVVGVPCNDFGGQEPGDAAQIQSFCSARFGVDFPLAAKASIVDSGRRHPFYSAVAGALGEDQLPRWNFHKYLVSASGELLGSWPSKVEPESAELTAAIEAALKA